MNTRTRMESYLLDRNPEATKVRFSRRNDKRRWVTVPESETMKPGIEYRAQAFEGQKCVEFEVFTVDDEPVLTPQEFEALTQPIGGLDVLPAEKPAEQTTETTAIGVLVDRIAADDRRIDELHQTILRLVAAVSTHAQGATGPLVKLIDQLGSSVMESNAAMTANLARRLAEIDKRENIVLDAEVEAENRLADANAQKEKSAQESAVLAGLVEHLAPKLLENLPLGGAANE